MMPHNLSVRCPRDDSAPVLFSTRHSRRQLGKRLTSSRNNGAEGTVNLVELAAAEMIDWLLRALRGLS
jgi:hypothetical protein